MPVTATQIHQTYDVVGALKILQESTIGSGHVFARARAKAASPAIFALDGIEEFIVLRNWFPPAAPEQQEKLVPCSFPDFYQSQDITREARLCRSMRRRPTPLRRQALNPHSETFRKFSDQSSFFSQGEAAA
jgi:hypothetical protein